MRKWNKRAFGVVNGWDNSCRGAAWRLARGVYIGWAEPLASISRCFPFNSVHNQVSQYLFSQRRNQQLYGLLRPVFHSLEIIPFPIHSWSAATSGLFESLLVS